MRATGIVPVLVVITGLVLAQGQPGEPGANRAAPPDGETEIHLGAGSCAAQACHGGGFEERMEYKVWATKDPHSRAFATLRSEAAQSMGRKLGYDVTTAEACLCCHGTTGVRTAETFDQADGVSCELCHGGAKAWLGPHVEAEWRRQPAEKKEREFGLLDLSTPRQRVDRCVTCHVGTKERPMNHAIMAAGHPPLVFDGAAFTKAMHPHWTDARDLAEETWLEGLRAAAVTELDRLAHAARDRRSWMEFSVFDCYACHHPVYQGTVYEHGRGTPGELPLDLAPLRVLIEVAGRGAELAPILEHTVAPNADPRELAGEAERAAKALRALDLGQPDPDRWRARLLDAFERGRQPPHVMQQLAHAIEALAPGRDEAAYRALLDAVDPTKPYDAARCAELGLKTLESAGIRRR